MKDNGPLEPGWFSSHKRCC